ncbi:MAG: hypothetical protein ABI415_11250 [Flavitalea sp.]
MNRFLIAVVILLCVCQGCKKENNSSVPATPDNTSEIVATCDDGDNLSKTYSQNEANDFSEYSFSGVAGTYFGYRSTFNFNEKAKIDISFGTILTADGALSNADVLKLIAPGEKAFGSLGSYTSYPKLLPNRVEIAYTDKKSQKWCSTMITEKQTSWGIDTQTEIRQEGSSFVIDKVASIQLTTGQGYRIQGHFECQLYELNGRHNKKIKGSFSGVISVRA